MVITTVGMGEGAVAAAPHIIRAAGCGSCVVLTLYDSKAKVGGLAHIMLPSPADPLCCLEPDSDEAYQYADTAVARLLKQMRRMGASRAGMIAKMAGGAAMFPSYSASSAGIGKQIVERVKGVLKRDGIPVAGRDTGGRHGRNVEFHLNTGRVVVTAFGMKDREI